MSAMEQNMEARRQRLLEEVRRLIESGGFEGLTMRELASASGVTVPTIYNLIGNKEAVLLAAVEEQTHGFTSALERVQGDLIEVVEATVRQLVRRPRYYRALLLALTSTEHAGAAQRYAAQALSRQIGRALTALEEANELATWVDSVAVSQRLHDHIDYAAIEWARGTLSSSAFRSAALLDTSLTLLGVTSGVSHKRFAQTAREHQVTAQRARGHGMRGGRAA
jgi:AcrR family transcriptional regulator